MNLTIRPGNPIQGVLTTSSPFPLPGDKSLSHRAALFAALALGESKIDNFLDSGVTKSLLKALRQSGVDWELKGNGLCVQGKGLNSLQASELPIDCGNSATTIRLLAGALAGQGVSAILDGSEGLRKRPMDRIVNPLQEMGVPISASENGCAPLILQAHKPQQKLRGGTFNLAQASAQVKTCLLLAGLGADREVIIREPAASRDHSERMLRAMGVQLKNPDPLTIALTPSEKQLKPLRMRLPGDFSAAAFLLVAALITPGSDLWIQGVGLNPGRTGLLDVLLAMGGNIELINKPDQAGEPIGDIHAQFSQLHAITISGNLVVRMIDEFPAFAIAATVAEGTSLVRDAQELRFKESDRITSLIAHLNSLGVRATEAEDGFSIVGGSRLKGTKVQSLGDHRLAMAIAIAGLVSESPIQIQSSEIINESFPHFGELFVSLGADMGWQG
ncbi:MAG: 3-phosphoshikimate 1-carboxyvinyltransferase [Anaerolineaceae bacterium]